MNSRTTSLLIIFILMGVGAGFSIGRLTAPVSDDKPRDDEGGRLPREVIFGAISPYSSDAVYMYPAMEIALDEVNGYARKLGLNVTFKISFMDADFSDSVAQQRFRSLHEAGAQVILGMWWSSQLEACRSYAEEHRVLVISSGSTAPSLAIPDDHIFRLVPSDSAQSKALARIIASRGIEAVLIFQQETVWGEDLASGFVKRFQELGGTMIDRIKYPARQIPSQADLARASEKIREAVQRYGVGKVAVEAVSMGEMEFLLPKVSTYPGLLDVPWFGADGYVRWVALVEDMPELSLKTGQYSPLTAVMESQKWRAFADEFHAKTGMRLRHYEPESYDSVWVAALAVIESGGYKAEDIKRVLPDICSNYFGASGWLKLDSNGDKETADYDVWAVTEESGVIGWRRVGRYSYLTDAVEWLK